MMETKTLKRFSTNSDVKMEVNSISDYLKPNMPLPQYLPYARFLLDTDLSHTAKLLYTLLLDRATLSQKNNWIDTQGHIYVIYPLSHLAKDLRMLHFQRNALFLPNWKTHSSWNVSAVDFPSPAAFCSRFRTLRKIALSQYAKTPSMTVQKRAV